VTTLEVICGNSIEEIPKLDRTYHSVVSDPDWGVPSALGVDGKSTQGWEVMYKPKPYQEFTERWARAAFDKTHPGGWLVAMGAANTIHRQAVGIEDAGWDIMDQIFWLHRGSGPFFGTHIQIEGWSTRLRPVGAPIILARRPYKGHGRTMTNTHLDLGTSLLNIDGCRTPEGKWPVNCIEIPKRTDELPPGPKHSTPKPLPLMQWLVRLVTPKGGWVLEPFAGSGTTVEAAGIEGMNCTGIELNPEWIPGIEWRIERVRNA
jgi:DNA modification methylase